MSLTSASSDSERVSLEVSAPDFKFFIFQRNSSTDFVKRNFESFPADDIIYDLNEFQDFLESCRGPTLLADLEDDDHLPDDDENDDENEDDEDYEEVLVHHQSDINVNF